MIKANFDDYEIYRNFAHKDKAKILKYIESCYNKESPLWKTYYGDLVKIRRESAIRAGMDPDQEWTKDIVEMRNTEVNELINFYICKVQNSNEYDLLIGDQHLLWDIQKQIRATADVADPVKRLNDNAKLSELANAASERIRERLELLFFREEKLQKLTEQQMRKTVEQRAMEFDSYKIKPKQSAKSDAPQPEPVKELDNIEDFEI